jgi:hypothetical protein
MTQHKCEPIGLSRDGTTYIGMCACQFVRCTDCGVWLPPDKTPKLQYRYAGNVALLCGECNTLSDE